MALVRRLVKGQNLDAIDHDGNIDHFELNPDGIMFPKESGVGVKIDTDTPDWGWGDIVGALGTFVDDVDRAVFSSYYGNISGLKFLVGKQGFVNFHVPHDYALGTDIYIHVHWSHNSATVTSGAPTFLIDGTYSKGHNQAAFGAPISLTLSEPASTTQYQHMVTEEVISSVGGVGGLIDKATIEPDGIMLLRVSTTANTMDGGAEPFVHFVDVHYQSTGLSTKNKSPNFYT